MTDKILKILGDYDRFYDDISVHISTSKSKNVQLNGFETESIDYSDDTTVYVRAVKEGKQVSCGFSGVDVDAIDSFLKVYEDAVAKLPADEFRFIPAYANVEGDLGLVDDIFENVSMKELMDIASTVTSTAMKYDSRVKSVKQSTASASKKITTLISTAGPIMTRAKTSFSAGAYAISSDGTDERDGYDFTLSTNLKGLDFQTSAIKAAENACLLLGAKHISTGDYHILFSADVMADFIELVLDLVDGDNVYKGISLLGEKMGENVASKVFTLVDDPSVYGGVGSRLFDDEGQRCSKIEIISEGKLKSFLHNSYTAKALGVKNNARGALSGSGNIGIGCTNILLASTTSESISDVCKDFLKITEVMGMHTADPVSGDFSVGISGVYYKDGQVAYPFKEAALSGNLADLLTGMIHAFDNRRTFGNITTSDTLFDKMTVSGV